MKSASPFQRANRLLVRVLALVMFFSCEQLAQAAHVTITQQPHSTNVLAGSNANFTVVASGTAPLSYQWLKGTELSAGVQLGDRSTLPARAWRLDPAPELPPRQQPASPTVPPPGD